VALRAPASATLLDWQQTAIDVIYLRQPQPAPIPSGVPLLGFTSVAVDNAVQASLRRQNSSERAAAAIAAYRVLNEYAPDQPSHAAYLLEKRAETFDALADSHATRVGRRIGRLAAMRMIASRVDDGRELAGSILYERLDVPGIWQPDPPGSLMGFAHLGFVDLLVLPRRVQLNGPDPLDSAAYAADFNEVKDLGSPPEPGDTAAEGRAATATFFNFNAATMVGSATIDHLRDEPVSVRRTARLFAAMHGAMTDSVITAWRLKFREAFWRPTAAIHRADEDGNAATAVDPTWTPLLPVPPYSDYVSGHASVTAPAVEVVRQMLGERTPLELVNTTLGESRTYGNLTRLEGAASNSRVWGGLHFRDAMDDGYALGHRTARRVMAALG